MSVTNIEWADRVWNPVTGCTKVSQGCKNCYAEGVANRFWKTQYPETLLCGSNINTITSDAHDRERAAGLTRARRFTDVWTHPDRLLEPLKWRKPSRIFVNSMSDLFHEDVPFEFIDRVFAVMALAPQHTFLVLTKRPVRMKNYLATGNRRELVALEAVRRQGSDTPDMVVRFWPLLNVHVGVSVEDQATADERIPGLLNTPAALRWVSYEPALGPVNFIRYLRPPGPPDPPRKGLTPRTWIDWIVFGGESGTGARPSDVAWARTTVDDGRLVGLPVFVKQLGARPFSVQDRICPRGGIKALAPDAPDGFYRHLKNGKGNDPSEWPEDLRVREFPKVRP